MRNNNGADFSRWLDRANARCAALSGLTLDDLPDSVHACYDAWDDGLSPDEYVDEVLAENGFPAPAPFEVVGVVEVDVDSGTITPVTYGDGSDAAAIAAEDVRRANWTPSNQYRGGRYIKSSYAPLTETVEAAIRIRKSGAPLPRLY